MPRPLAWSGGIWEVRLAMDSGESEGMSSRRVSQDGSQSPPSRYSVDMVFAGLVTLATVLGKSMRQQLVASGGQGGLWGLTDGVSRGKKPG